MDISIGFEAIGDVTLSPIQCGNNRRGVLYIKDGKICQLSMIKTRAADNELEIGAILVKRLANPFECEKIEIEEEYHIGDFFKYNYFSSGELTESEDILLVRKDHSVVIFMMRIMENYYVRDIRFYKYPEGVNRRSIAVRIIQMIERFVIENKNKAYIEIIERGDITREILESLYYHHSLHSYENFRSYFKIINN